MILKPGLDFKDWRLMKVSTWHKENSQYMLFSFKKLKAIPVSDNPRQNVCLFLVLTFVGVVTTNPGLRPPFLEQADH